MKMYTEINVDWLTYNTPTLDKSLDWLPPQPTRGGNYRWEHVCAETGAKAQWGNQATEKYHVIMPAQTVLALPIPAGEWIEGSLNNGAEFTRLDIALTQYIDHDGLLTVPAFLNWFRQGKVQSRWNEEGATTLRKDKTEDEKIHAPELETTYIGSWDKRARKGIFRVYDKGKDLDLEKFLMTRFEIEDKRKHAQSSARAIAAGDSLASVFRGRIDADDEYWRAMLDAPVSDFMTGKQKTEKRAELAEEKWAWLNHQVAPALARAIAEDWMLYSTMQNYNDFISKVMSMAEKHAQKIGEMDRSLEYE